MINKVILVGNLGQDPDMKMTSGGKAVVNLSLATSFGSGEKERTEWHRIVVWDKLAENVSKYTRKGSKLFIEGRLETRKYEDKDGATRYTTEIVANEVKFLDSKKDTGGGADNDLPF